MTHTFCVYAFIISVCVCVCVCVCGGGCTHKILVLFKGIVLKILKSVILKMGWTKINGAVRKIINAKKTKKGISL